MNDCILRVISLFVEEESDRERDFVIVLHLILISLEWSVDSSMERKREEDRK